MIADDIGAWETEEILCGNQAEILTAEELPLQRDMEDTRESRGRKFSGSTAMILGLFITLELMIGGAMIFNYDFHGADLIALLFAFMVLYSGVVAVLTDK